MSSLVGNRARRLGKPGQRKRSSCRTSHFIPDKINFDANTYRGGAVHSPHVYVLPNTFTLSFLTHFSQILQLSGIGPATELKQHGITPVVDLPGVGKRLVDHPVVDLYFKDKRNASAKWLQPRSLTDVFHALGAVAQYKMGLAGPLAMNVYDILSISPFQITDTA